jgi:hypothetical protein
MSLFCGAPPLRSRCAGRGARQIAPLYGISRAISRERGGAHCTRERGQAPRSGALKRAAGRDGERWRGSAATEGRQQKAGDRRQATDAGNEKGGACVRRRPVVAGVGFEPTTFGLRARRATAAPSRVVQEEVCQSEQGSVKPVGEGDRRGRSVGRVERVALATAYFPTELPPQYRERWGVSLPFSEWERVVPPRSSHQSHSQDWPEEECADAAVDSILPARSHA